MFGYDDAIAQGAKLGGGLIGNIASQGDRVKAEKDRLQALHSWLDINVPDPAQQKLILDRYQQTGMLHPEIEQAISQGPSAQNNIQVDPTAKNAQLKALSALENVGLSGGMTDMDKADYAGLESNVAANDRGRRGAIEASMARRGAGGSGLSLAAQLDGAQDATNRLAQGSMEKIASAKQRALDAMLKGGQLAGGIRDQDYSQARDTAGANDAISRFNTANKQSVQQRNIAAQNAAQEFNLNRAQDIANKNTDISNSEQKYNKGLIQQQFENKTKIAAGASGQYNANAKANDAAADRTGEQYAGAGDAIGKGVDASGQRDRENARYTDYMDRVYGKKPAPAQPSYTDEYDKDYWGSLS